MVHSKKMGLSVTATKNIRRQLEKLDKALKEKEDTPKIVRTALKNFNEKFAKLEEEIIPKGFGYRGSMEMALRGGSLSQQLMMLGASISGYPSVPTKTELSQLKELSEAVNALASRLNEFMSVEIPKLNEILEEHSLKPLKTPKKVSL
jgi:RNA processing factor Prp31